MESLVAASVIVSIACPHCDLHCAQSDVGYLCTACGWREDRCETCGDLMRFSPEYRGFTGGGLTFIGALECSNCKVYRLCKRSKPATDALDWKLSGTRLSLMAGTVKVHAARADESATRAVMTRIARVPEHEANEIELERLYDLLSRPGWARNRC